MGDGQPAVDAAVRGVEAESRRFGCVLAPGPRDSIEEVAVSRAGVLVAKYSNVRGQLVRYTFDGKQWAARGCR